MEYQSKYGLIKGVSRENYYASGQLRECQIEAYNQIQTNVGILIPKYENYDTRSKYRNALAFYKSGDLKSIYLDRQQLIRTPLGEKMAELITFYEGGTIHRVFPLYGQISGYWSEEEELALIETLNLDIGSVNINAKVSCYCFYPSGKLKSLTLCKNETIEIETMYGKISGHLGTSFYEDGGIKSIEPNQPVKINTLAGDCWSFNNISIGVHGDKNSLCFYPDGSVSSLITSMSKVEIIGEGKKVVISPALVPSELDLECMEVAPIKIAFTKEDLIEITDISGNVYTYDLHNYKVIFQDIDLRSKGNCSGKCEGCLSVC